MNLYPIVALSGHSDGGPGPSISAFLFALVAFAPVGALLNGGWSAIGGLIWLSNDGLAVWRLWSSVTVWGNRRGWHRWWIWLVASATGLAAYLALNLVIALAVHYLR